MGGPGAMSRYLFTTGIREGDTTFLTERVPFRYRELADNVIHVAQAGDTWDSLAGRYYGDMPRGCGFWWAIADYQPEPVVDPTIALEPGARIVIPSQRVLTTIILGERRRREHG